MLNNCEICPYKFCRRIAPTTTFRSDLAIVGTFINNEELIANKPFVGKPGDLLKQTLTKANLTQTPFITNALLCKPINDKLVKKEAIIACRTRLIEELKAVKPKIILALGNIAVQALTNDFSLKISQVHGKPIESPYGLVLPIYHPSKVLHSPGDYKTFLNGFIYANALLNGDVKKDPGVTTYQLVTERNVLELTNKLVNSKLISCDIETTSLNPKQASILAIGFGYCTNKVIIYPVDFLPYTKSIFKDCRAIGYHRGQFDTAVLNEHNIPATVNHDTLLLHYVLNENEGSHDLKTLSKRFLGAESYETGIDKTKMKDLFKSDLFTYLAKDCDYTYQLLNMFLPMVESDAGLSMLYYQILLPGINFLRRMSQYGFMVDRDYLTTYKVRVKEELDKLEQQTVNLLGQYYDRTAYLSETTAKSAPKVLNIRSDDQMRWLLFDKLNVRPKIIKRTPTGKICIDAEVLESIQPIPESIKSLLAYNKLDKIFNTYIVGIENKVDDDNRLRSSFSLQTTVTGRLSSSKPNVQNIPRNKEVKNIFRAPPNRLLIEADYKGLELRLLAHFSQDPYLIKAFKENRDIHNELSFEIFGSTFTKEQRVAVKGVVFGSVYGRTAHTIAQEFNISLGEAQMILNGWLGKIPVAMQYMDKQEQHLLSGEPFITPFGRQRRYGVIVGDQPQRNESRNFKIQSSGSDLNLISAMDMELPLNQQDTFIVNIIHDSILLEAPNHMKKVMESINIINTTMMQTPVTWLQSEVNFPVEISVGFSWGNMKEIDISTKKFKP